MTSPRLELQFIRLWQAFEEKRLKPHYKSLLKHYIALVAMCVRY